jgi:Glycine zipper
MMVNTRRIGALAALAAICALGACNKADNSALQQDSTLTRDLARAGTDTTAQPALKDVPPAEAPAPTRPKSQPKAPAPKTNPPPKNNPPAVTPTPVPVNPAPAPAPAPARTGEVAAGTTVALTSSDKVCTNTQKVGDRFTATVNQTISGSNGVVIPAGSKAIIELTTLHRSENANDRIVMGFRLVSIEVNGKTYFPDADVVTAQVDRVAASTGADVAKKVGVGAVAGAIIGQVIGRDRKGTLIGAAVGAAAGGAAAAATAKHDGCVNNGAAITIKLNQSLTITVAA